MEPIAKGNKDRGTDVQLVRLRDLYKKYNWHDIASHQAIVLVPYTISSMSMAEYYRLNVPLLMPSLRLTVQWELEHSVLLERIYGNPQRLSKSAISYDPNSRTIDDILYWLPFSDWLQWPHIVLFDSPEDLYQKLAATNFTEVSERMQVENQHQLRKLEQLWYQVFTTTLSPFAPGQRVTPPSFDAAMEALYPGIKMHDNDWCIPDHPGKFADPIFSWKE